MAGFQCRLPSHTFDHALDELLGGLSSRNLTVTDLFNGDIQTPNINNSNWQKQIEIGLL
jgi:hypothetical protein